MIKSLHISNYALISELDIDFAPGFNIITGETGAGKSIILGALSLLLGGRADLKAVRDAGRKSVIEAVFDIQGVPVVPDILRENELDGADAADCILRRELLPGGRSRAFVNDTPVTLNILRDIAVRLVDIHSQHQNLLLADADYQLSVVDNLADNSALKEKYAEAFHNYRKALKKYTDTRDMLRRNRDDAEFIAFQFEQLDRMRLQPGEHKALEAERELLTNVSSIKETLSEALDPISNRRDNAVVQMSEAVEALEKLAETLGDPADDDVDVRALSERLESARIEVQDIAETLVDYDLSIGADPDRLDEVEERLSKLYSLELKHHVDDSDDLIKLRDKLAEQLEALEDSDGVLAALEREAKKAKKAAYTLAVELSERRAASAAAFGAVLRNRAMPLGMPNLRCEIQLTKGKLAPNGYDQIQFLFAFNKNQTLVPVGQTASGGEISRLMLTIKSIVAERMQLPSIIFDEVDTGVSGDVANRMAEMMDNISRHIQVITITHLPGVAAMGERHFKVYKEDDEQATRTRIRSLSNAERTAELALMISGDPHNPAALANAAALLAKRKANNENN
ncbi:MAG: DNA repair protein RecN [Bacteroidales bacterium]|nr:DNA repair protein RecN [Bacteroidales bacterium]